MRPTHYPVSRAAAVISAVAAALAAAATLLIEAHILEPATETLLQTIIAALAGPTAAYGVTARTWHHITPTQRPPQTDTPKRRAPRRAR